MFSRIHSVKLGKVMNSTLRWATQKDGQTDTHTEAEERDKRFRVEQQGPQPWVFGVTFTLGPSRNGGQKGRRENG